MAFTIPLNLLGTQVSGDLDGMSIYTDRFGRKVWYPKAPPTIPPSTAQQAQRERFKNARASWKATDATTKANYEELTNQASICMTGQNLWISVSLRHNLDTLKTLQRQTGITVINPPLF